MTDGFLFLWVSCRTWHDLTDPWSLPMMQALATIQSVQGFRIRPDAAWEPSDLLSDVPHSGTVATMFPHQSFFVAIKSLTGPHSLLKSMQSCTHSQLRKSPSWRLYPFKSKSGGGTPHANSQFYHVDEFWAPRAVNQTTISLSSRPTCSQVCRRPHVLLHRI